MFKELVRRIRQDFSGERNWAIIWHRVKCIALCILAIIGSIVISFCMINFVIQSEIWPIIGAPLAVSTFILSGAGSIYLIIKIIEISVDQEDDILYPKRKDY